MNTMNMPGFTAEASLYNVKGYYTGRYRQEALGGQRGEPQRTVVIPQLPRDEVGRGGFGLCINDCVELHPDWPAGRCITACRDPGGIPGSGSGQTRDAASIALCWYGYSLCTAVGFEAFRPDLWASCLFGGPCSCEEIRDECLSG
jgi:hypothetical protein